MTAEQLLTADLPSVGEPRSAESRMVQLIRTSFAAAEPHTDELGRFFYATLFAPRNLGITSDPVIVSIIGLGIYTGAFVTEAIRSPAMLMVPWRG